MTLLFLSLIALVLAAIPVALFFVNLRQFRVAPAMPPSAEPVPCSILIPARNEERSIRACIEAALLSVGVQLEVIVLDDHSTDATAAIVGEIAGRDGRLRLEPAPPLPAGWCGKQHACQVLSRLAKYDQLLFVDADLQLSSDAARRAIRFLHESHCALVSAFPRQQTGSVLEHLLIPMIHVVLLGYLPFRLMRDKIDPALAAGCGQFFLARRSDYVKAGGHWTIRASLHDGITLPRSFRAAGLRTDLFDGTDTSLCRMYRSNTECWNGLSKNAIEGLAAPKTIVSWTLLLLGGHVMPFVLLFAILSAGKLSAAALISVAAITGLCAMRATAAIRFRESWLGVLLHPAAVLILIAIQWTSMVRHVMGRPAVWKSRSYVKAA